jgi:hypothetical protein
VRQGSRRRAAALPLWIKVCHTHACCTRGHCFPIRTRPRMTSSGKRFEACAGHIVEDAPPPLHPAAACAARPRTPHAANSCWPPRVARRANVNVRPHPSLPEHKARPPEPWRPAQRPGGTGATGFVPARAAWALSQPSTARADFVRDAQPPPPARAFKRRPRAHCTARVGDASSMRAQLKCSAAHPCARAPWRRAAGVHWTLAAMPAHGVT